MRTTKKQRARANDMSTRQCTSIRIDSIEKKERNEEKREIIIINRCLCICGNAKSRETRKTYKREKTSETCVLLIWFSRIYSTTIFWLHIFVHLIFFLYIFYFPPFTRTRSQRKTTRRPTQEYGGRSNKWNIACQYNYTTQNRIISAAEKSDWIFAFFSSCSTRH